MKATPYLILLFCAALMGGCGGQQQKKAEAPTPKENPNALKELKIEDIVKGKPTEYIKNLKPTETGDAVWVVYTGRLADGTIFDSNDPSLYPEKFPYQFTIGAREVIPGWEEGLKGMLPGGKRKLSIPAKLAYGQNPPPGGKIKPGDDLFFDVELVDVVKKDDAEIYDTIDEKVGSGPVAEDGKTVTVHYTIKLVNGYLLDDTRAQNAPQTFKIGASEVQRTFEIAIKGMRKGGVRLIRMPPNIGFRPAVEGENQPGNAVTYTRVELIDVK